MLTAPRASEMDFFDNLMRPRDEPELSVAAVVFSENFLGWPRRNQRTEGLAGQSVDPLHNRGDALTDADAHRREAIAAAASLHLVN